MGNSIYNKEYTRKVNKNSIPVCNIMGVDIAAINMEWLIDYIDKNLHELSGDYICVSNVHTTVTAYDEPEYMKVQNGGIMAVPDGGPLSSVGRKRGHKNMSRTVGPGIMEEVFKNFGNCFTCTGGVNKKKNDITDQNAEHDTDKRSKQRLESLIS